MGVIYLDSCLLIYLLEGDPRRSRQVAERMARASRQHFGISPLAQLECLVGPTKRGDPVLERAYAELFARFSSLDMPLPVYAQAARLRAQFLLKMPDALHLSCAQHHRCNALWTDDNRLAKASHGLATNVLK